tara:strand:+ start:896 stop:1198 length:303 start_codon:yes stop_codon:yes gene_type:complete
MSRNVIDWPEKLLADRANVALPLPSTVLALSGGSDKGAFSAGLLNAWTRRGDRPSFDLVSGVSTGALIAPFAFLGSDQDDERNGSGGDGCLPQIAIAPSP